MADDKKLILGIVQEKAEGSDIFELRLRKGLNEDQKAGLVHSIAHAMCKDLDLNLVISISMLTYFEVNKFPKETAEMFINEIRNAYRKKGIELDLSERKEPSGSLVFPLGGLQGIKS